jgi:hypothetical protein
MLLSPTTVVGLVSFLAHDGSKTSSRIAIALIAKREHIAPNTAPLTARVAHNDSMVDKY